MANIRKSFNFRSGLQVDNDNFVINSNGLVGIGTSIPSGYLLNVYGDTRITGLTTAKTIYLSENLEVSGVTTVGFITASSLEVSGGVNVGTALTVPLLKVGSSELVDNLIGYARTTFITDNGGVGLHTTSKIGINTSTSPGASDPTLSVFGDVNITGVVTATEFDGNINASKLTNGTIPDDRFPAALPTIDGSAITNLDGSNITSGTIDASYISTLNQNTTGTAGGLTGTPDITVGVITSSNISNSVKVSTQDITVSGNVGIGTDDTTYETHIRRTGTVEQSILKITSDQKESIVAIGRSTSITDPDNETALLRFGNTNLLYQYSSYDTLDIINQGNGNINSYIDSDPIDNAFMWLRGTNTPLMTLTRDGNLGVGITNPTHKLNVQGISTFTGSAYFNSNVTVEQNLEVIGDLILSSDSFQADIIGNVNSTSGISTFFDIEVNNQSSLANVSINDAPFFNTNFADSRLSVNSTTSSRFYVDQVGNVGISTTLAFEEVALNVNGNIISSGVGVGTTSLKSGVDFSDAGNVTQRYMIPPKVTTTERNNIVSVVEGGLIYNTTNQRLELYLGSSWVGIATEV